MTLLGLAGGLLTLLGLTVLWRITDRANAADALARFGLLVSILCLLAFFIASGLHQMIVHVLQHDGFTDLSPAQELTFAEGMQVTRYAVMLMFSYCGPVATIALGLGLAARFGGGWQQQAARAAAAAAALSLVVAVIGTFSHEAVESVLFAYGLYIFAVNAWYVLLGLDLVRGHAELSPA